MTARKLSRQLLISAASLGVTLLGIEITMRLTIPPYAQDKPHYVNHEALGYWLAPNRRYEEVSPQGEFHEVYFTDNQGIMIHTDSTTPDPDRERILFLGDSFMIGTKVSPGESIAEQAVSFLNETSTPQYQGFNLALPGYSTLHQLLVYTESTGTI
jgi:hypothetical protein